MSEGVLRPFSISERALAECQFGLDVDSQFESQDRYSVEQKFLESGIRPKFKLSFDADCFTAEAQRPPRDVSIAIVARDLARRDYRVLQRFAVDDLPITWQTPQPISSSEELDFEIIAYLPNAHSQQLGRAWRVGSILGQVSFKVRAQVPSFVFPISEADFTGNDLWRIHWQADPDFDAPVEEVLELRINSRAYENLRSMVKVPGAGNVLNRMLAANVFEVVAKRVLEEHDFDSVDNEENGLASVVLTTLQNVTGHSLENLRAYADDTEFLRRASQEACRLIEAVNGIA